MNKEQAIHSFWSGFGLEAYDENQVPADAMMPYITYSVSTSSLDSPVQLHGSLWYHSTSWRDISLKSQEIAAAIGYGHKIIKLDDGYLYITKGTPFAQRMSDPADANIRRIYINLTVEFLTAF